MSGLRAALERVRTDMGELTPAAVVNAWRAAEHPEHARLEWNDTAAGEAWRREQAHRLITSVRVAYTAPDGRPKATRGYLAVPHPDRQQPDYVPTPEALSDPLTRTVVLRQAEREWRVMFARYGDLAEFAELVRADVAS